MGRPAKESRPATRGGCPVEGPCPFVSCRHHLLLDVTRTGTIRAAGQTSLFRRDNDDKADTWGDEFVEHLAEAEHTCSLDVAEVGSSNLTEIAVHFGCTREWIRQVEEKALRKLREVVEPEMLVTLVEALSERRGHLESVESMHHSLPNGAELKRGIEKLAQHEAAFFARRNVG